jgi:SseB protein N-terminal domain
MNQQAYLRRTKELIWMTDNSDIDKLVEVAAQENSPAARQRLFQTIRMTEVFAPCELDPHDPNKVRSTPLARLSDGTHAMMLFTSKSHPHLSEHQHFTGGAFSDHLSAALKMPPLDWVILSNSAWQRVAIHKQQIAAILDDLNSDGRGQNYLQVPSAGDAASTVLEDFITQSARSESGEVPERVSAALRDRELFLELAAGQSEDGQPVLKTFQIQHLAHVVRVYTSRIRPGIKYGGIQWNPLKDMIRAAPGIGGVQIMNNADDWIVFDREALRLGASDQ